MRELTKSWASFSWAMAAFGLQQTLNLFSANTGDDRHPAASAFDNVTKATRKELGDFTSAVFRTGDNIQKGMVDATFSALRGMDIGDAVRGATDSARHASGAAGSCSRCGGGDSRSGVGVCRRCGSSRCSCGARVR